MEIKVFDSVDKLYVEVASYYIKKIIDNPSIILGLATGGTMEPLYKLLVDDYNKNKTDYSKVKTFNLDEYVGLPKGHNQSYRYFMNKHLFSHVNIKLANTHVPVGNKLLADESAIDYEKLLSRNPRDIQLLGLGQNGHIGFNEPGTSFDSITHVVNLTDKTREDNARFFLNLNEVPHHAITMGIKSIVFAKEIIIIAVGLNKAKAVKSMIKGTVDEECPASILQKHSNCIVYLDKEAASLL